MATKVAEVFATVGLDMSRFMSGITAVQSATQSAASDIAAKMDAIRKSAEFTVKLQGISGVSQVRSVLDGIVSKIVQAKHEMQGLTALRGQVGAVSMGPQRPEVQSQLNEIDARRATIISQVTQLLAMRTQAEAKLTAELGNQTQAIIAQARAQDTNRSKRMGVRPEAYDLAEYSLSKRNTNTPADERFQQIRIAELTAAHNRLKQAQMESGASAAIAAGGYNRMHFALQQASFGVQDFLTVYGTMGLRGALMASANNFAQVAAIINPVQGALYGLGITLGSVLIPYLFNTKSGAEKAREAIDALADAFERLRNASDFKADIRAAQDVATVEDSKTASRDIEKAQRDITEADAKRADLAERQAELNKRNLPRQVGQLTPAELAMLRNHETGPEGGPSLEEKKQSILGDRFGPGATIDMETGAVMGGRTQEELDEALKAQKELDKEIGATNEKRIAAEKRIIELRKKGQEEANKDIEESKRFEEYRAENIEHGLSADAAEKLAKMQQDFDKREEERGRQVESGALTLGQSWKLSSQDFDRTRRDADEVRAADAKKQADEEKRKKLEVTRLTRDIEKDGLNDRAKKFKEIADQLEDRRDSIIEKVSDPDERRKLLDKAAAAAEHQMAAMRSVGGDKIATSGLADAMQKALFAGGLEKDAAATAKNTSDMKTHLETLIKEVQKKQVGVAG